MYDNNVYAELEQFDRVWEEAEVEGGNKYENLPDGKYQVKIDEIRFENAKTSGRLQLAWVFKVLSPATAANRKIFHYRGLDEESVKWMKQEVWKCGLEVEKITDLPHVLENLLDRVIEVTLKTKKNDKGEFQNCFINKLLDEADGSSKAIENEDSVPF